MAPNVLNSSDFKVKDINKIKEIKSKLREFKKFIKDNFKYVGDNFAQEARKASLGERDDHIYGKATDKEIKELHNEGIGAIEIPDVKDH